MGADKAILVTVDNPETPDSPALARILAVSVAPLSGHCATGQMSDDFGSGEIGPQVAEFLDLPQVSSATRVEASGSTLTVHRDTEDGKQIVEVQTPVLIMAMTGLNEPRYPSLKGIMAAKKKPLETVAAAAVPRPELPGRRLLHRSARLVAPSCRMTPADAAKQLVAWLRENKLI